MATKFEGVHQGLDAIQDESLRSEMYRVLYGVSKPFPTLPIPEDVAANAETYDFEVKVQIFIIHSIKYIYS